MNLQIKASDIDFGMKSFDDMRRRHERRMYPPRIKMTVSLYNSDTRVKLPVKFSGYVKDDYQLDTELILPIGNENIILYYKLFLLIIMLGLPLSSPTSSLSTGSQNTEAQSRNVIYM